MTTTMSRNGSKVPAPPGPVEPMARTRRRWNSTRTLIGAAVVALCAITAVVLFSSAADRTAAVMMVRDVPAGSKIDAADLGSAAVSASGKVRTIPASQADTIVGRIAAVDLTAGSLLNPAQVTDAAALPAGTVVAAAVLKDGQAPADLTAGDVVEIVETTTADASGTSDAVSRGTGTVLDVSSPGDGEGDSVVSLAVPSKDAVSVSAAGAAGRVSLVVTNP